MTFDTCYSGSTTVIFVNGMTMKLTCPDMGQGELQSALGRLSQSRFEHGLNRVTWLGGLGLKVKFENQYSGNT